MTGRSIVLYQPDKGAAFCHALRPSQPAAAWQAVQSFLDSCAEDIGTSGMRLVAYQATDWDNAELVAPIVESAIRRFGPADIAASGGMNISTGQPVAGGYLEWRGDGLAWPELVQFVVGGHPWPKTTLGPVSAQITFQFNWKTVLGPKPLLGSMNTIENQLHVSLERMSFAQPRFWFPYPVGSPALAQLVRRVVSTAPFRFTARHFRAATPNKDGTGLLFRRFDASSLLTA